MLCRSVQLCRPSVSTSGGQSARGLCRVERGLDVVMVLGEVEEEGREVGGDGEERDGEVEVCCFAMAAQAATDVHDRHLSHI